jgi:hypothetical protein
MITEKYRLVKRKLQTFADIVAGNPRTEPAYQTGIILSRPSLGVTVVIYLDGKALHIMEQLHSITEEHQVNYNYHGLHRVYDLQQDLTGVEIQPGQYFTPNFFMNIENTFLHIHGNLPPTSVHTVETFLFYYEKI